MAWHRHRIKRRKQSKKRQARNVGAKRDLKKLTKQLLALIKEKKIDDAKAHLRKIIKTYATSAKRGIIHKKSASRRISRLTQRVNTIGLKTPNQDSALRTP